jgi:hypothetical protein
MSDRDDLDTLDLDPAFDRLRADVDSRTRARGAERAIRSASHRRLAGAGEGASRSRRTGRGPSRHARTARQPVGPSGGHADVGPTA